MTKNSWIMPAIVIGVALVAFGFIKLPALTGLSTVEAPSVESQAGCYGLSFSGLTLSTYLPLAGTNSTPVNVLMYSDDSNVRASADADTASANPKAVSTTLGTVFDGKAYVGNDNFWGTDRGTEVYFVKVPLSWNCKADPTYRAEVYPESGITWTGYDDGVVESTLNVSVQTTTIYTTELKLASATAGCIGNKQIANPVGVCFNVSGSGTGSATGDWDAVKPAASYIANTIPVPGYLASKQIIGAQCYVLNTPALCDGADYRFSVTLDPGATAIGGATLYAIPIEATYTERDDGSVVTDFGDESNLAADADIGISSIGNEKGILLE